MNRFYKTSKGTELPLLNLRGRDYLEVKYRLVWFREDHPNWSIETEFVSSTDQSACAKDIVRDETGKVIATSHKFENEKGFPDFMEKAETGAIGRALALIGYGTQFCADEFDEGERIVDAPVSRPLEEPRVAEEAIASSAEPQDEQAQSSPDLGEYQIAFGKKYRGKRLRDIAQKDIESYVAWLEADAEKKNTPLSHDAKVLKRVVELYFHGAHEERALPAAEGKGFAEAS